MKHEVKFSGTAGKLEDFYISGDPDGTWPN